MTGGGLGDMGSWLPDREEAERGMYRPAPNVPDQQEPPASTVASTSDSTAASESASISAIDDEGEVETVQTAVKTTTDVPTPPPPARQQNLRAQFNHRILADREKLLQKYKQRHSTTMQAIVDQMVDEYLTRRGLLPEDKK
jgi:hypothetical protein